MGILFSEDINQQYFSTRRPLGSTFANGCALCRNVWFSACGLFRLFGLVFPFLVRRSSCLLLPQIGINLLVVYRESVNMIAYITRRLSADSLQLRIAMKIGYFEHVMLVSHLSAHHAQCLKPMNCRCKHKKTFFPKRYFTFLCNETTSKFILKQLDYLPSFLSQLSCASLIICS